MASHARTALSPGEYLAQERAADRRSEYIDGVVVAMAGASERHNTIVANLVASLHGPLRGRGCRVYAADMRVKAGSSYTYPDVVAVCGPPVLEDDELDTLVNPVLIVEVLSESTERYDRGRKAWRYREIATLRDHLLVAQDAAHVECWSRVGLGTGWQFSEVTALEGRIDLPSTGATLLLADVYDTVVFEP